MPPSAPLRDTSSAKAQDSTGQRTAPRGLTLTGEGAFGRQFRLDVMLKAEPR